MDFEKREDGCIRFKDTDGINFDVWTKILNAINHLGYRLPDESFVKEYFNRGVFLQPDQSKEVLRVLNHEHNK